MFTVSPRRSGLGARLLAAPLLAGLAFAQSAVEPERIGLVLSGGGARGCAHVGVLKVLEELRIPIHCIAGTSMGSIVGGLYAYGLPPERLEEELTRAGDRRPWSVLLQDQPDRAVRSFRRKQEDFEYLVDFGLGWKDGAFRLPKGLVQGQNLELELTAFTVGAHDLASFDLLPIPFRAVAVELRTGKQVVMDRGNLASAMRASMSLPGVFAPAIVDGVELLDGGLVDNVPIDVARAMGATRVIVVDIGTPLRDEDAASTIAVTTQMIAILTQQNVDRSIARVAAGDVFVQPDLGDISSSDFLRADEAIRIGEAAARAVADRLRPLGVDEATYARFRAVQRRVGQPVTIRELRFENHSAFADDVILARLRVQPGRVLDVEQLREDIDALYGLGDFERITYELRKAPGGLHDLVLQVAEKSWGPAFVRFGLSLTSNLEGRSDFSVGTQINVREINSLGAEWRTSASVGESSRLDSEFYQPLEATRTLFVAPRVAATRREIVASGAAVFEVRAYAVGLDVGAALGACSELRLGVTRVTGDIDVDFVLPIGGLDFDDGLVQAQWVADTFDEADFPTRGVRAGIGWQGGYDGLGADQEYQKLSLAGSGYVTVDRTTVGLGAIVDTELEGSLPLYQLPGLGGFTRLSGLDPGTLGGRHAGLIALLMRYRVAGRQADAFGFPFYLGGSFEAGQAGDDREDVLRHRRLAGSLFAAVNTPLGPTYLAYGYAEGGEQSFYLFVGQVF